MSRLRTTIPESVTQLRIGPFLYSVRIEAELAKAVGVTGACGPDTQTIVLDDQLGPDVVKDTVLHESLHGIINQIGWDQRFKKLVDDGTGTEEEFVRPFATALFNFIRANPALIRWLSRK